MVKGIKRLNFSFLIVFALLALLLLPLEKAEAGVDDGEFVLIGTGQEATCVLLNDSGQQLFFNSWSGKMDAEMAVYRKVEDYSDEYWCPCYWFCVDRSPAYSFKFKDESSSLLNVRAHGFDARAVKCKELRAFREEGSSMHIANMKGVLGKFFVGTDCDDANGCGSGVAIAGCCKSTSDLSVTDKSDRFVLEGLSEGEIEISANGGTADAVKRYYALGDSVAVSQKWRSIYDCAPACVSGALPIKCGSSKSLRAGKARVSSELGGSAMWLMWDEVKGAKSYRVYEKRGKKWKGVALRAGVKSSYALVRGAGAGVHRYKVRAFSDRAGRKPLGKAGFVLSAVPSTDATRANVDSVSLSKSKVSGRAGQTKRLRAVVHAASGKRPLSGSVRWFSSNPKVAKVDKCGRIRMLKSGSCRVWAVAHDGVRSSKVTVKVSKAKAKPKRANQGKRLKSSAFMAASI